MTNRPTSITVIGWLLIVLGALGALGMIMALGISTPEMQELMAKNPIPIPIQYAMSFAGLAISIVSGYFMLKGQNWARLLYVIWSAVGFLIGLATSPMKIAMIPGIVVFLLIVFFLFRPKANAFFAGTGLAP